MDLSSLDTKKFSEEGAELQLDHPATGAPLFDDNGEPVVIRVVGSDSSIWRNAIKRIADKQASGGKKKVGMDEMEKRSAELLAACTLSWENIERDGEQLKCTQENAEKLYIDFPWIREQVDAFVGRRANFIKS